MFLFSQGYAYPTNGYVQTTGIQFDPSYSRTATTYSSPTIQRYEFQAQQINPINQVSLQSVSFAPNVTYSQIASPAVLLNHQQHHHYNAHQQHDQLGNKPMAISATLTTSASGNETPGYPRVNSVPPRSLNCNGYPGMNEYGGNSSNSSLNTQNITNTSTSQTTQMQPPLTQSPGRQQPSRPNSTNNIYQQQQSPSHYNNNVHMSPRSQPRSPSNQPLNGGSSAQHYQQPNRMNTPTSHHQSEGQQDWNQNTWSGDHQQSNDIFNQSDRINLNTRLKTMILNKNDKDQQQSSTNHFLSYSHQHLLEPQQPLTNEKNKNNDSKQSSNDKKVIEETGDVGGSEIIDSWKSKSTKQKQDENKSENSYLKKQQMIDEEMCHKASDNVRKSSTKETDAKTIEQNDSSSYNNCIGTLFDQQESQSPNAENVNKNPTKKDSTTENEKQSYSYHSAHEYQQHKNMVNNIKKEPCEESSPGNIKFEGYEKNYQNFIRYADFCDAQQPQYESHQKQAAFQQDFVQPQGYYNNYPYQNYAAPSQNYTQPHSQSYQQFMTQQAAYQQHAHQQQVHHHPHASSSLTNFEQQIPLHTYPIPKHASSTSIGETILPPTANIKTETPYSTALHSSSPLLNENMARVDKDEIKLYSRPISEELIENSLPLKEEVSYNGSNITQNLIPFIQQIVNEKVLKDEVTTETKCLNLKATSHNSGSSRSKKQAQKDINNERNNKPEVPDCDCFSTDKKPPEPGSYYTHLGKNSFQFYLVKKNFNF